MRRSAANHPVRLGVLGVLVPWCLNPAAAAPESELLRGASIAPELGTSDQVEPRIALDGGAPIASAIEAPAPAPAPAPTKSAPPADASKAPAGDGQSLRERLAARSYKNETASAPAGGTVTAYGRRSEAFVNAIKLIDQLQREKAKNPSQAIGAYQGGDAALKNAAELPSEGFGFVVPAWLKQRATNFGTDQMVFGLMEVFALVADTWPDSPAVVLGDIGKKEGGPLAPHVSHRTGRDVDLSLFGLTNDGKCINRMISYNAQGMSGDIKFDLARNWDFAAYILECKRFEVVFILVDQPLKDLLIKFAKEKLGKARSDGEAQRLTKLIKDAENYIRDGGHEHSNHYHLRIK